MKKLFLAPFLLCLWVNIAVAQSIHNPSVDVQVIDQLMKEGIENSKVMEIASWLTDVYGPRLTNSPQMKRANEFTSRILEEYGMENVHMHKWGPFGTGWELKKFAMHANSPYAYFPLIAYPKAWSPGYNRTVKGEVVHLRINSPEDYEKYRGKLRGKFVMVEEPYTAEQQWDPIASRFSDSELLRLANATEPPVITRQGGGANAAALARQQSAYERAQFLTNERPLAILDQSYRGWYGQVAVSGATLPAEPGTPWGDRPRPYDVDSPAPIPQISMAREHYGRIFRLLEKGIPVTIEMDLQVEFQKDDLYAYNTIAEIPGTDPEIGHEVVMIGAHLDSWHTGTGATDNASGSAVMIEAMRILKAIGVEPRRTIRIALWSGEEQGLHGSREYVSEFFGEAGPGGSVVRKSDYDNFSAYYNIDNGTGQVRGIYLQQNEALRPLFREWLRPFADWGANTVTFSNTSGTDHLSFDRVGLPGFQFIQDRIEYFTMTHHSNQDVYERLVEQDLQRTAIIVASFVYHTAMLDERLPRKGGQTEAGTTAAN
jgi:carboxypeptidase Q